MKKIVITILLIIYGTLPLLLYSRLSPLSDGYHTLFKILIPVVALFSVIIAYKKIKTDIDGKKKAALFVLLILLAIMLNDIHFTTVDEGHYRNSPNDNTYWQINLHKDILQLNPAALPHSYRFLPDSVTFYFEYLTGSYVYSRALYRNIVTFFLLFSIYYYARLYYNHKTAIAAVLLYAAIYPVSIRYYAGQLTDPLSHLFFVLTFIFIETNNFFYFSLSVFFGIFAKESIIVMPAYRLFFTKTDNLTKKGLFALLLMLAAIAYIERFLIQHGCFKYENISGVAWSFYHAKVTLGRYHLWVRQFCFTIGILIPFYILAWRDLNRNLRNTVLFLAPVLFISNVMFSNIYEARNFIPVVIPMAVITAGYLFERHNGNPQ